MKIAELYLVCKCGRIPEWTRVTKTVDEQGHTVKNYEFDGMCPWCGSGEFTVMEVKNEWKITNKEETRTP